MPRTPSHSKEDSTKAALLVVEKGYTIAAAHHETGVSRFIIRKLLNDYGAENVDMRHYSQFTSERKNRRNLVLDAISETKSFAEAGRRYGMSRQRAFQIWKLHGDKYKAAK